MILWLNPRTGISGDMMLGALLDLGAPVDGVRDAIAETGLNGWRLDSERVQVDGISATQAVVSVDDDASERHPGELLEMIDQVRDPAIAALASRAVIAIAEVEAQIHGVSPDRVHLHEIGGHDTIVDTVGVAAALSYLQVDSVISEPVAVGAGVVSTAHGVLPAPAPAAAALLAGAVIVGSSVTGETVTPTGAALLRAANTIYDQIPAAILLRTGYGAGTKRFPGVPNVLQASLLRRVARRGPHEQMTFPLATVDDSTGLAPNGRQTFTDVEAQGDAKIRTGE